MKIKFFVAAFLAGSMFLSIPAIAQTTDTRMMSYGEDESYINTKEDGHSYKIRLKGNKVTEMEVDGKIIPAADYPKYDAFIKKLLKQMEEDRRQAELDRQQAEKDRQQADKDRLQAGKDRAQAELDRQQAEKDRAQADKDRAQADKDRLSAEADRKRAEKDRAQAERDRQQAEKDRKQAEIDRQQAEADRKLYEQMITELISDQLLDNRSALRSIELDNASFSINGVKQPEAVQKKYAAKYLKGKKGSMRVSHSGAMNDEL